MNRLDYYIEAVEDNNEINDAAWSDWKDATDIIGCYSHTIPKNCKYDDLSNEQIQDALNRLIETNGEEK